MDIAIDVTFEPRDAFRATVMATEEAPRRAPSPIPAPPVRRATLWPVAICAFIAFTSATVAFLKSPLAAHPRVAPYAAALMAKLG